MAGMRVVPVRSDLPLDNLTAIFNQLNGFILPGGSSPITNNSATVAVCDTEMMLVKSPTTDTNREMCGVRCSSSQESLSAASMIVIF